MDMILAGAFYRKAKTASLGGLLHGGSEGIRTLDLLRDRETC